MTRRGKILLALLVPCLAWAVWQWSRPYEWSPDPDAGARIEFARVQRDKSYYWLDLRLKVTDPARHDLAKGIVLVLADGREKRPDGLTLEGSGNGGVNESGPALGQVDGLSLKFWMEPTEIPGPLTLRINDGLLEVRKNGTLPPLEDGGSKVHHTSAW